MRSLLPKALGLVPPAIRRMIIGRSDQPSRLATVFHKLVNSAAPDLSTAFACRGPLQGFRMSTDWARYRGYIYGNWEPVATRAVIANAEPGMCVFDIGGHLGYYTLLLAKCVGPAGRVVSFEAAPGNFATLKRNVAMNGLSNVELINLALFSGTGTIRLSVAPTGTFSGDWSTNPRTDGHSIQVRTISLDQYCRANRLSPEFLKIDVEGAEYDVLIGGRETILRSRPILLIELHHFEGDLANNPVPDLLKRWNYNIEWLEKWAQTSQILARISERNLSH